MVTVMTMINEAAEPPKHNEAAGPLNHDGRLKTCNASSHVGALFSHGRPHRDKTYKPSSHEGEVQQTKGWVWSLPHAPIKTPIKKLRI